MRLPRLRKLAHLQKLSLNSGAWRPLCGTCKRTYCPNGNGIRGLVSWCAKRWSCGSDIWCWNLSATLSVRSSCPMSVSGKSWCWRNCDSKGNLREFSSISWGELNQSELELQLNCWVFLQPSAHFDAHNSRSLWFEWTAAIQKNNLILNCLTNLQIFSKAGVVG